jgi:glutathione peroxidase
MRAFVSVGLLSLFVLFPSLPAQEKKVPAVLNFKMKSLDGKDVELSKYQGKVVLIVNVASECGYTGQYKGLQALHDKYASKGLVVLGVPCNDFGKQEPGTEAEIAKFCATNYSVKFDMLSKVSITGKDPAPLYKFLTDKQTNPKSGGVVKWNFTKFLIGRNGEIVARFESDVEPDAATLIKAIEAELAKK